MKACVNKLVKEIFIFLFFFFFASIILAIPYVLFVDKFGKMGGVPVFIQIPLLPLVTIESIIYKHYWIFLFIPYILFITIKFISLKFDKRISTKKFMILISIVFFVLSMALTSKIFDCDLNRNYAPGNNNGYFYKAKKDVCYAWLTAAYSPLPHSTLRIPETDFNTFKVLEHGYAMDDSHVYFDNGVLACPECIQYDFEITKIEGANPNTFMVLNKIYAKDKNSVYCNGIKMNISDVESFEITGGDTAKDKNYEYKNCEIISE